MATINRRASSLPARAATGSQNDMVLLQSEFEAKVASSPLQEPRSPPVVATFSPVFELELGGSCASTPQDRRCRGSRTPQDGVSRRCVADAVGPISLRTFPPATPATEALKKVSNRLSQKKAANPAVRGLRVSTRLDRSVSDLQVMWARGKVGVAAASANAGTALLTPSGEQLAELCKPTCDLERELAQQLRAFHAARITRKPPPYSADLIPARPSSSLIASSSPPPQQPPLRSMGPYSADAGSPAGTTPGEIEALASELQSAGFLVQILDGTRLSKDARSCLRTLKHRFLVCLGRALAPVPQALRQDCGCRVPAPRSLDLTDAAVHGSAGAGGGGCGDRECGQELEEQQQSERQEPEQGPESQSPSQSQLQGAREELLNEPVVVEVRFREQFLIPHSTRAYQLLLLALPVVFVGPLRRLDAVVDLMAAEVAAVFKEAKRPLPPWRTKGAMLSKWAPTQLGELGRLMRCAVLPQPHQLFQCQPLDELAKSEKSAASAIGVQEKSTAQHTVAAAAAVVMARDPLSEPLEPWSRLGRSTDDGIVRAAAAAGTVVAAAGRDDVTDDESGVAHRSNSAPPRTAAGPRSSATGPSDVGGGGGPITAIDSGVPTQSETGLEILNLDTLDQLMRQTLTSISQVEPEVAAVVVAGRNVRSLATAKQQNAMREAPLSSPPTEPATDTTPQAFAAELSFPILPEISPMTDVGPVLAVIRPTGRDGQEAVTVANVVPPQPSPPLVSRTGEANSTMAPSLPPVVPTFQPYRGLSALSPFACVSVPEQYDEQDSPDVESYNGGSGGVKPAPWSARLSSVTASGDYSSIAYTQPEFTFNPTHGVHGEDLDPGRRNMLGGSELRHGPSTRPPLLFAATDSSVGTIAAAAPHLTETRGIIPATSPLTSCTANSDGMNLVHQPLAKGSLSLYRGCAADATAAAAPSPPAAAVMADPPRPLPPAATHPGGIRQGAGEVDYPMSHFVGKPDTLHITRRSSSDLHRAAEKFKKAKSLLAVALRLTKGSGSGNGSREAGGIATSENDDNCSAPAAEGFGANHTDEQQQQQQRGAMRESKPAAAATRAGAASHRPGGGGTGGGLQVALAGGVMTQPSGNEPPWARIRTVKWNQSAAATATATATAGAVATAAAATMAGPGPAADV
ncbi:hypothetical protein Vafri_16553 [Volvox africanus]|uniref:Uncharacterized protein n=1 Tax=Volvox africanus TaxID=51714 RepID=A0A8J4BK18_9CHLO|nr:hypothetical protein Vafri_16553 [Volvox africanus]